MLKKTKKVPTNRRQKTSVNTLPPSKPRGMSLVTIRNENEDLSRSSSFLYASTSYIFSTDMELKEVILCLYHIKTQPLHPRWEQRQAHPPFMNVCSPSWCANRINCTFTYMSDTMAGHQRNYHTRNPLIRTPHIIWRRETLAIEHAYSKCAHYNLVLVSFFNGLNCVTHLVKRYECNLQWHSKYELCVNALEILIFS